MQSRSQFLVTGLVPVKTLDEAAQDCSICTSVYTNPVKLPCGHTFDKKCIEKWLNMPHRSTCPMCKTKLFDLPRDEDPGLGEDRRQQVAAALRNSTLGEQNAISTVETFGSKLSAVSELQRATANACHYLGQEASERQSVSGPAAIHTGKIVANFVAMANLIPNFATSQGRAYTQQQRKDWKLVMTHLSAVLKAQEGKRRDALLLPAKLRNDLKTNMKACYSDVDYIEFFFTYADPSYANPCYDDLDVLFHYLTSQCWTVQREQDAAAAKCREPKAKSDRSRREPKMKSPCGVM